jgi:Mn-containing catalase
MTREVAHQKSFEKALYAIEDNFPSGKNPGNPKFANLYVNSSQGPGDMEGPWNSGPLWERDEGPTSALDGGDGLATVELAERDQSALTALATRTRSEPGADPMTGAELGAGPGSGLTGAGRA